MIHNILMPGRMAEGLASLKASFHTALIKREEIFCCCRCSWQVSGGCQSLTKLAQLGTALETDGLEGVEEWCCCCCSPDLASLSNLPSIPVYGRKDGRAAWGLSPRARGGWGTILLLLAACYPTSKGGWQVRSTLLLPPLPGMGGGLQGTEKVAR
jgi:hypothetical protein